MTDTRMDDFELKLKQIEDHIEKENEHANFNRMKVRFFMFFLLIGSDDETKNLLERKVRDLLRNPDACEFMQISEQTGTDSCAEEFEKVLNRAADKHVDVQNLNNIFLCPIVFADNSENIDVVSVLGSIDAFVKHFGKKPTWQPFVVIHRSVSQYNRIYSAFSLMEQFIRTDKGGEYINRCCVLSDQDGNGFTVTKENIMQTIAMTVVLQNIENKNVGAAQSINSIVKIDSNSVSDSSLFFTARNAAITNPIRSLTLERMRSAIDYFSGSIDDTSRQAINKIDYSFIGNIISPYLKKLPRLNNKITFFPLYAVMKSPNLRNDLEQVINKYYIEPLQGKEARAERLDNAKKEFLRRFFEANGSLFALRELIASKNLSQIFLQSYKNALGVLPIEDPLPNRPKLRDFNEGIYLEARNYCEKVVRQSGITLLEELGSDLSGSEISSLISAAENALRMTKDAIENRIRTLRDVETVLVLDRTLHNTDFGEVQNAWIVDEAEKNANAYNTHNKRFDYAIYSMIVERSGLDIGRILEVCYEAVKDRGYSNVEYLERLSEECIVNESRANEFAGIVEKSWCYTLRLMKHDENSDSTCIIGDPRNRFCETLQKKFRASLFSLEGFDRIDVLHISAPFKSSDIWEWEQIKQQAEGAMQ
ncbi:MAG: hypothetical protein IJY93_08965 [Clostridia bacterium]|nr:hypothetical protein [Clostridia bacterium]